MGDMVQSRITTEQQMAALDQVLQALRAPQSPESLVQTTVDYLYQSGTYPLIWIAFYDPHRKQLAGMGGKTTGDPAVLHQTLSLAPGDRFDQAVFQQRPITIADLRQENHLGIWQKIAQKGQVQGTLIHPILAGNQCLGVALLGTNLWGQLQRPEELSRLSIVLNSLAASLAQPQPSTPAPATASSPSRSQTEVLLHLLQEVTNKGDLDQRLLCVTQEVQTILTPSHTSLYWWQPELQSFQRRLQIHPKTATKTSGKGSPGGNSGDPGYRISPADIPGFYQGLSRGQLVAIGDIQSSITNTAPQRLMQQLRLRALMAAPILFQGELLGFITLEMTNPRLWQEPEKQYLQAAAQILSLVAPLNRVEQLLHQGQQEQLLWTNIARALYSDQTWKETLRQVADQFCKYLRADRILLLQRDPQTQGFQAYFQTQLPKQRPLTELLRPLSNLDLQTLEQQPVVSIENLQGDLRFAPWREPLLQIGVHSALICNTNPYGGLDTLLLISQDSFRYWSQEDTRVATTMAQQLGLLMYQWHLQHQNTEQQTAYQTVQRSLSTLEKTQNLERLELAALGDLLQTMQVPLAALVTWKPGHQQGWVVVPEGIPHRFSVQTDATINVDSDPLIQAALDQIQQEQDPHNPHPGIVMLQLSDLPSQTRTWLCGAEIGQIIAMALQTDPEYQASGVVVLADRQDRVWSPLQLDALRTFIRHFSWAHRSIALTQFLQTQWQNLECLNWYKHRRVEELYRQLAQSHHSLVSLTPQLVPSIESQFTPVLKQMHHALATMPALIKSESWRLRFNSESVLLVSLIKRSVQRLESLVKQNQLRIQVHSSDAITLVGDIPKIDLLIYELLVAAGHRLAAEGRIDIWCQPLEAEWVEISITDNGIIDSQLLIDLHHRAHQDLLAPSSFDRLPGRHLKVCQMLAEKLKGEVDIYKLEDGRTLSRLVLPLQN
jgi:GAF domain-containing protein